MDLKPEDIIKGAIITAKSKLLADKLGKITFKINRAANKLMVRNAVEKLWDVKVDKVAVINVKGESRRFSGRKYVTQLVKKAIVTLKKGYKIDMSWQQSESIAPVEAEKLPEGV